MTIESWSLPVLLILCRSWQPLMSAFLSLFAGPKHETHWVSDSVKFRSATVPNLTSMCQRGAAALPAHITSAASAAFRFE
jgi:hypothetical protein